MSNAATTYTVLLVEDEDSIGNFMAAILSANQYRVLTAKNGKQALMMVTSACPDLMILDLGLPDMDGVEIIKAVRQWSTIPIVVVSARTHERDKVEALDLGVDDYVTKPFGTAELLARVRLCIRRYYSGRTQAGMQEGIFIAGDLRIDYARREITVEGEKVHLTQNEYKIVSLLSRYAGRVLTYEFIMKELWGPNLPDNNQILRVNMANIRRKLEKNPAEPKYIFTEMGVGYFMVDGTEN
ncbi:MAG: response regulator transcription factor [Eubacteriales bacterium]|nr:response regulator transcription factor [Eubacteriales bacterium]